MVTLVGGEPMMRPDIVELFAKEFPKRACVVTNGTYQLPYLKDIYFYWISIDGDKKIHDEIRGQEAWQKTKHIVMKYLQDNGKDSWKDIWITMTINSKNYHTIRQVIKDWKEYTNKIGFQFHTPFVKDDPLWIPFGKKGDKIIDEQIMLHDEYKDYIINPKKQLEVMKKNWGGRGTTPINCPTWTIISVDHKGHEKLPCCIGSSDDDSMRPICEQCGLGCYSVLLGYGIKGIS